MQARNNLAAQRIMHRWRRQKVRLLVLVGKRKSGKDVFVEYVMKNYRGFRHYRIAEALTLIAKILELPEDRKILQKLFEVNALLRPILGESAYKRRVARMLDRERPKLAIVEAIRTREEYKEFVRKRGGILIGVTADSRFCYERALFDAKHDKEKRDEGKMSFREFMARDTLPIERDIDWIVRRAHFVIENNYKNRAPFCREIDKIMAALGCKS